HPVADGEQKHQEEDRLERSRDCDPDLADDDRADQRRGHGSEAQALVTEGAEVISERQRQEDGDFRGGFQRMEEPLDHDVTPHAFAAAVASWSSCAFIWAAWSRDADSRPISRRWQARS